MTKENRNILMSAIEENCTHIKKVKRKEIVFNNGWWSMEAYRFIFKTPELFKICGGMYQNGGGNILYFK